MQFLFFPFRSFSLFINTPTHMHTRTYITFYFFLFNVFLLFLASLLRSLFVPFCRPFSLCYL